MEKHIAVIGIGALFPDAVDLSEYWSNILSRKNCIKDIPADYWNLEDFYDADPSARDKTYGYKAGVVSPIDFDSAEFGIPPKVMESVAVDQLFALVVAKQALMDADMIGENAKPFNRDKTGVILAAGLGKTAFSLSHRLEAPRIRKILINSGVPEDIAERVIERFRDVELDWNEACNPGYLANVVAGRISNRFDFSGTNCTVDAACASSLSAVKYAIHELQSKSCDIVLTGGVNLDCSAFSFISFSKTPAISKSNLSRPFDKDTDGMIMGDGIGMMVLKRLEDAERDGDRIYAVIRSVGASGDGKAKSIFAPSREGQIKVMERAYEQAEIDPKTIGLIEAHGTGTERGDESEASSLIAFFRSYSADDESIGLGSVKSQIGHARLAAGAAGMIKAIMALHHKILPPTINVDSPSALLKDSPLYIINKPRPWIVNRSNPVRRAGVSAFGFGGTNFHVVLEEYGGDHKGAYRMHHMPREVVIHAGSRENLARLCEGLIKELSENGRAVLDRLAAGEGEIPAEDARIGFVAKDAEDAYSILQTALPLLKNKTEEQWDHPALGIYYRERAVEVEGSVVALFPGQGSQYVEMLGSLAQNYPDMRSMLELVDNALLDNNDVPVSSIIYPASMYEKERLEELGQKLTLTRYTQPALAAVCGGIYKILEGRGFRADYFMGHSFGELTSLWAAGAIHDTEYARLSVMRGSLMSGGLSHQEDRGSMLAIGADLQTARDLISGFSGICIANENSPSQIIVSGDSGQIEQLDKKLKEENIRGKRLNVSGAFHSPLMKEAQQAFSEVIKSSSFHDIESNVFCNATAQLYPESSSDIKDIFARQIISPVLFQSAIEKIYGAGGRIFVEIGPKKVLSSLVEQILGKKDCHILSINPSSGTDAEVQMRQTLVRLKVLGMNLKEDGYQRKLCVSGKAKSISTYTVKPTLFFTPEKQKKMDRALDEVDDVCLKRPLPFAGEPEVIEDGGGSAMTGGKSEEVRTVYEAPTQEGETKIIREAGGKDSLWAIYEIQNLNTGVFEQFMKSQSGQMDVLKEISAGQAGIAQSLKEDPHVAKVMDSMSRYIDITGQFQKNSMDAYNTFFCEQSKLIERYFEAENRWEPELDNTQFIEHKAGKQELIPSMAESLHEERERIPRAAEAKNTGLQADTTALARETHEAVKPQAGAEPSKSYMPVLFSIISEKTGYPEEMLEPDMDIETDLGIDSIKRVEIFSALNSSIANGFEQEDVEVLAAFSTIREIAGYIDGRYATEGRGACSAEEQTTPGAVASGDTAMPVPLEREIQSTFLRIISDKTGYPEEMLEPDMDIETDLGIDSIKRVEIFSALNNEMPEGFNQDDFDSLSRLSTLKGIIGYLHSRYSAKGGAAVQEGQRGEIKRFEVEKRDMPLGQVQPENTLRRGNVIVTCDKTGVWKELFPLLMEKGFSPVLLQAGESDEYKIPASVRLENMKEGFDEKDVEELFGTIAGQPGGLCGIINILPCAGDMENIKEVFDKSQLGMASSAFFMAKHFYSHHLNAKEEVKHFFINVVRMDGELGLGGGSTAAVLQGSLFGLGKSLSQEWNNVLCRTVDIHPKCGAEKAARYIMEELYDGNPHAVEIGRGLSGERITLGLKESYDTEFSGNMPSKEDVFVIPGGGRGISAQCAIGMAKRFGCKFILLGRTALNEDIDEWSPVSADKKLLRKQVMEDARSRGNALKPAELDKTVNLIANRIEIKETLKKIEEAGGRAVYMSCDITDAFSVKECIEKAASSLGKITGLIHGAGVLADKKIHRKTQEDFEAVFNTKVKGLECILDSIDQGQLRYLLLFSSVAAFFGSGGQSDYSMANEVLNKFAHQYGRLFAGTMVMSINWGPWDGGMVEETLKMILRNIGAKIIPMETGVAYLVDELCYKHGNGVRQIVVNGTDYPVLPKVDMNAMELVRA
ncbi:polyketide-type polyunsaturated fatty acid synthase PfaA [Anaerobacterium chartisolvens]|uniref:Polyketide-type polyunsaturated fatty acid synthase PfaA n=1 Tax=Anaerobacterium chartisolvens TaxID=1297424 RepID=A0A369BF06_9FIRM|nr:type I polyketide synthase [Anaerobacterium chartisolvens]RCX20119.1 polyketide-type polyunsaturated fatty acid synthase PfaA [Anaerobacterium chartisolvens]